MNYYPHHIGDYLRDTAHLTATEDGIYRRMLDVYYASEKPLPLAIEYICRLVRAHEEPSRLAVEILLQEFFEKKEDGWHNKRADEEIRKSRRRIKAAKTNGKKGGRPLTQEKPSGLPVGSQKKALQTQNQIDKQASAFAPPDWVDAEQWRAFEEHRRKLRKPMTDRARRLILSELEKLKEQGHDPLKVIDQSIRRGWQDVFPIKDQAGTVSPLYRREGVM